MDDQLPITPEILVSRIGDYMVDRGWVSPEHLASALQRQDELRQQGRTVLVGELLVEMGYVNKATLDRAVTEQIIRLRAALEESNRTLELRVIERTAELKQALDKLSELGQLKNNFVSNISHELRTPLTHIKGYLELFLSADLGPINNEQTRALAVMLRSSDRLGRLIDDLILFSMAEHGQVQIVPHPLNPQNMCEILIDRFQSRAEEKQISLKLNSESYLPGVTADEEKITWVLQQLLDNAIKFTPEGGKVTLSLQNTYPTVTFCVRDTGIGIPADKVNDIFDPFFQLDGSSTRKFGGTGLGLALVKAILDAHNVTLQVESSPNQGSCFTFKLPVI